MRAVAFDRGIYPMIGSGLVDEFTRLRAAGAN
jgi:hypothetical protein